MGTVTITEVTGDLFDFPYIAHGANTVGVMGAGVAGEIGRRWPDIKTRYERYCRYGALVPGDLMWDWPDGQHEIVVHLGTQRQPGACADVELIKSSLEQMVRLCFMLQLLNIAIPKIGCGIGGLDWERDVRPIVYGLADRGIPGGKNATLNIWVVSLP